MNSIVSIVSIVFIVSIVSSIYRIHHIHRIYRTNHTYRTNRINRIYRVNRINRTHRILVSIWTEFADTWQPRMPKRRDALHRATPVERVFDEVCRSLLNGVMLFVLLYMKRCWLEMQ